MKLEIYEPENGKVQEEPVRLRLSQLDNGIIFLDVVDENGNGVTTLLDITSDGKIELLSDVDDNLGFQLDKDGCVIVEKL